MPRGIYARAKTSKATPTANVLKPSYRKPQGSVLGAGDTDYSLPSEMPHGAHTAAQKAIDAVLMTDQLKMAHRILTGLLEDKLAAMHRNIMQTGQRPTSDEIKELGEIGEAIEEIEAI